MPSGPWLGREERSRRGGWTCSPGVRWERWTWGAGRDSETTQHKPIHCLSHFACKKIRPAVREPWYDSPRYCRTLVSVLLWDVLGLVDRPVVPSATRIMSTCQPAALDTQRIGRSQYVAASKSETRHVAVKHQPLWQTLFSWRTRQREIQKENQTSCSRFFRQKPYFYSPWTLAHWSDHNVLIKNPCPTNFSSL